MAIVQFAIAYNHHLVLTDAVRTGARVAAVSRSAPDPAGAAVDAVVRSASGLDPATVRANTRVVSTWEAGSDVTVVATYPYTIDVFGIPVTSGSLTSTTTERVE